MINVKLAFENGNCDIDLLKAVLIEMSEELNSLRSNGALKTKHNEKLILVVILVLSPTVILLVTIF